MKAKNIREKMSSVVGGSAYNSNSGYGGSGYGGSGYGGNSGGYGGNSGGYGSSKYDNFDNKKKN